MKNLIFPIAIESGDADHAFGVIVPDIPGCHAAGDTLEEAYANAKEAIEAHLDVLLDEGLPIPGRLTLEKHRQNPEYAGFAWGFVATRNIPALKKAVRINISLPEVLVHEIDTYAQTRGMSRSAFLALAAEHEMADA
ncbi:type II toxin-antitoxin system HicB family antitoxin [Paraburkholderia sp. FT54]|jgi:predicted RNase H-like HicB family nuclease|uniref:type II toxin-antitoxin system HicB family antitoxin n=1 Tax=Paraburkholderia sp. FT54 TaxID=3074437 RepID=UPI0028778B8F|nr:type II toxin-antitoxin system HicB family antitoxin [Paraburkholderia sp. FT54]WNC89889.1 type II toxin-antitoxin system HicB family antitoxin [Paraburkholderia sp. FT54]